MSDYRRAHVPGGTYFFTVNIYRANLADADVRYALREAIGMLSLTHSFVIEAWVCCLTTCMPSGHCLPEMRISPTVWRTSSEWSRALPRTSAMSPIVVLTNAVIEDVVTSLTTQRRFVKLIATSPRSVRFIRSSYMKNRNW